MLFSPEIIAPGGDKCWCHRDLLRTSPQSKAVFPSGNFPSHCLSGECSHLFKLSPLDITSLDFLTLRSEMQDTSPCPGRKSLLHSQPEDSCRSGPSGPASEPVTNSVGKVRASREGSQPQSRSCEEWKEFSSLEKLAE
uniref:Uncharacterized protein n=1 Tax=Myotis myotis TaxID=51298 RepID=A0A7J7RLT7_MYOMY|nr:hypothetical protein mMyoMyo1_010286 [Myotis myotis]